MNNEHLVSIVTPIFNSAAFLDATIESILAQTWQHWELILVDDQSEDDSLSIAESYVARDSRIRLVQLEKRSGPAVARNRAIREANGRFIAFLDSDDVWDPQKLEKQISFMIDNGYGFTTTWYEEMTEEGERTGTIVKPPEQISYRDMLKTNHIGCLTAVYDVEQFGKMYMPLIKRRQDYGLWFSLLQKEKYAWCLPEVLATYRVRTSSVSSNKLRLLKYNWKLLREEEGLPVHTSVYYFSHQIARKVKSILQI